METTIHIADTHFELPINARNGTDIFDKRSEMTLASLVTIAWGLWFRRNKMVFENKVMHPLEAFNYALALQVDYMEAKDDVQKPSLHKQSLNPSKLGSLKLNIDGAIFPK